MKLINKIFFSLSILIVATVVTTAAIADIRGNNYNGQGEWYSNSATPAVKVFIKDAFVYVKLNNRKLNLSPVKLKQVNGNLLNEYTADYILIQDFTQDRFLDIGVLKSVGYGGSNRCYAVFEYFPKFYSYKSKSRKTVCID